MISLQLPRQIHFKGMPQNLSELTFKNMYRWVQGEITFSAYSYTTAYTYNKGKLFTFVFDFPLPHAS